MPFLGTTIHAATNDGLAQLSVGLTVGGLADLGVGVGFL
jgi:hypothetical protein